MESPFAQTQEEPSSNEATIRFGKAEESRHEAPRNKQKGQIVPGLEVLDYPVRRNVNGNVRDIEDH